jgi:hypothetical protein
VPHLASRLGALRLVPGQHLAAGPHDTAGREYVAGDGGEQHPEEESFAGAFERLAPRNEPERSVRRNSQGELLRGGTLAGEALGGCGECGPSVGQRAINIHPSIVH